MSVNGENVLRQVGDSALRSRRRPVEVEPVEVKTTQGEKEIEMETVTEQAAAPKRRGRPPKNPAAAGATNGAAEATSNGEAVAPKQRRKRKVVAATGPLLDVNNLPDPSLLPIPYLIKCVKQAKAYKDDFAKLTDEE